ncbi:hypothetical protein IVA98_24755 [Bradyrhizobium sp. 160]|uniref:hypothetical protein n=1 Tax=Bradyrhizobium sp. 160 TaxID=2782634 RepID=UPI001FF77DF0|nr:hypothetical protein [Bradyrhizobium sp. 160]MCK1626309.1 hypothetical protein [Bradyrhizobium sp. 160]
MTRWHPSLDLARLLETLSGEILATTDEEVRQTSSLQGWNVAGAALEVRDLISAAGADADENPHRNFDQDRNEDSGESAAGLRLARRRRSSAHHHRH